ncbi:hypothetical protein LZ30DRAFT_413340 [Colletotrichum cereale]|nr:hypothetical protein LZ30DRAFT_413340 [Colletotrichum cereale]
MRSGQPLCTDRFRQTLTKVQNCDSITLPRLQLLLHPFSVYQSSLPPTSLVFPFFLFSCGTLTKSPTPSFSLLFFTRPRTRETEQHILFLYSSRHQTSDKERRGEPIKPFPISDLVRLLPTRLPDHLPFLRSSTASESRVQGGKRREREGGSARAETRQAGRRWSQQHQHRSLPSHRDREETQAHAASRRPSPPHRQPTSPAAALTIPSLRDIKPFKVPRPGPSPRFL